MKTRSSESLGFTLMIVAVTFWAASFIWLKVALRTLPPGGLAAARFILASLLLLGITLPFPKIRGILLSRAPWPTFLVIGFLGTFLPNILQNFGMKYLSASLSGVVQGTGPIYTAILAAFILHEHLGPRKIVGAVVAIAGTIFLFLGSGDVGDLSALGVGLLAMSAISYALYTVTLRKSLLDRMNPMALLTGSMLAGTIPLMLFTIIVEPLGAMFSLNRSEVVLVLTLAFLPTVLAYACYVGALGRLEASKASAFIFLIPVGALLLGVIYLDETLTITQAAYCAMIIGGVALAESERTMNRTAKPRIKGVETLDKI